jgi:hypothetical protein
MSCKKIIEITLLVGDLSDMLRMFFFLAFQPIVVVFSQPISGR